MARTVMVPAKRRRYWAVVEDSLVEIHGLTKREARQRISLLLKDLASAPPEIDTEIIYHAEQFAIANDLAGQQLDRAKYTDVYHRIVLRHYGVALQNPAQAAAGR
jgi:hypothetical protein